MLEEYDRALAEYDTALRLDPDFGNAYGVRGLIKRAMGDAQGAEQDFRKAKELGVNVGVD